MVILFLIIMIFIIAIPFLCLIYNYNSIILDENAIKAQKARVVLTDINDRPLESKYLYRYIPYDDISIYIVNAFVALEDKRFFTHRGVDYYRMAGALFHNIGAGKIKEGGSTITQQLAKNTLLSSEKTIRRKLTEIKLAKEIEKKYSKEDIIEMYLNAIYYGNGIYGIDSACYNYFGKDPSQLSIAEAAILAGIVKNPTKYSPTNNPQAATGRKDLVLKLMLEQGLITDEEYDSAIEYSYRKPILETDILRPIYSNALFEAAKILGISEKQLIVSPYRIKTYCDTDILRSVCDAFDSKTFSLQNLDDHAYSYSVLLSDNKTGGITAYYTSGDNNLFLTRRSPASTIKPILVYAPAIENGIITEKTILEDKRLSFNGYSPKNFGDSYCGPVYADEALAQSINTVAVQVLQMNGIKNSVAYAKDAGITFSESDNNLALALGGMTYGVTIPELSESYMTLANGGKHTETTFIRSIERTDGKLIYKHIPTFERVFSSATAYIVTDMLTKCVYDGTARKLNGTGFQIASKTGTNESASGKGNNDAWNVSYTTKDTLCVWYGDMDGSDETGLDVTGSGLPTLLAAQIRKNIPAPTVSTFLMPSSVIACEFDSYALEKDGKLYYASPHTPLLYRKQGYFSIDNYPNAPSPYFDINTIEFDIKTLGGKLLPSATSDSPFNYKLIERNLSSGETKQYDGIPEQIDTDKNALYSYYLAVYCESEFLGYSANKLIFT